MYSRAINYQNHAFFLFGPRGTGKSTWVRQAFPDAHIIDLLPTRNSLKYRQNPGLIQAEIQALPKTSWIVIDEVQKVPDLLDDIHDLIENHGYKNFVLTGSSARKLKRGSANMLAGRAFRRDLFPLTCKEMNFEVNLERLMEFGQLPASVNFSNDQLCREFLTSYLEVYLDQEVKAEALVKDIGTFSRFLLASSLVASKPLNVSAIARECGASRDTVRGYLEVLEDTLLGFKLPAYRPRAKIKEVAAAKFYWFDQGVLTAAATQGFAQPIPADWRGIQLEHMIAHELRAYKSYNSIGGSLGYWATKDSEVDFVWWKGSNVVGIEVKASVRWRPEYLKGIESFSQSKELQRSFIVYLGDERLQFGNTQVLPVLSFLQELHAGRVF